MNIPRRKFIKWFQVFCGFVFTFPLLNRHGLNAAKLSKSDSTTKSLPQHDANPVKALVISKECPSYDYEMLYGAVKNAVEELGFDISSYRKVLLKPNIMSQNFPEQAASTHPAVVDAVCRLFSENGASVTIGDSSAFFQPGITRKGLETTGMKAVADKYNAQLLPFEACGLHKITTGKALKDFYITQAAFDHDLIVDLPKLKVHRLARYSGAIKNMYGCVVGGTKQLYHLMFQKRKDYIEYWGKPLVDVFEAVHPGLTIMDAVVGLDKDGPAATGEPRKTGLILASENATALDVVMCSIIDFDWGWIPAVREAVHRGLVDPAQITVNGPTPKIPYARLYRGKPKKGLGKKFDRYIMSSMIVQPRISRKRCTGCGTCVEKCPVHAITLDKKHHGRIDLDTCIRCYCCSEFCPNEALTFDGPPINDFFQVVRKRKKL